MRRLFLDANVLLTAAHRPTGKAAFLIGLAAGANLELFTSAYAVEEARRNLCRKTPHALEEFAAIVEGLRLAPDNPALPYPDCLPEKDQPIFRAALACADVLLTGDLRDFGALMNAPERTNGLLIQTVADFLSSL